MATPAASAWHRRRHVLVTPTSNVNSIHKASALRSSAKPQPESAPPPASHGFGPRYNSNQAEWSPRESLINTQYRQLSSRSQFHFLRRLTSVLRSGTQSGMLKSAAITLLSVLVANFIMRFTGGIMALLSPTTHKVPNYVTLHRFPYILFIFSMAASFFLVVTLFSMQFMFAHIIRKEMRSWKLHLRSRLNADHGHTRLQILHAIGSTSSCVLQTVLLAYVVYGPSMAPAVKEDYMHSNFFPSWSNLSLHVIQAVCSGIVFSVIWMWVESHSMHHNPFCLSSLRRFLQHIPRILLLSGVPVLCAAFPSWLIHLILADGSSTSLSELGLWASLISGFGKRIAALICTMTTLLSWNIISALEDYVFDPSAISYVGDRAVRPSPLLADDLSWHRDRISVIAQKFESVKVQDDQPEETTRQLLESLHVITQTDEGILEYPGYVDSTGNVWRSTLKVCLSPIDLFQESLREYNVSQFHPMASAGRGNRPLFLVPSRSGFSSVWLLFQGARKSFCFPEPDMCITSSQVVAKLAASSYELDRFGVIHRTLPQLMRSLLACKEQTEAFISARESGISVRESNLAFSLDETRVMQWCRNVLRLPSDYDMVVAVDDALTLSIHRVVSTFRNHMYSFVDGGEISWDRSQDRLLRQFLDHETM